jgi:AraC-like DNA-binding protein
MLDEAALAELCPRWPRFAFRPIPVDRGLAVMLRAHILSLAAHLGEMDSRSATALASPTLALIAAWLNSLDCEPHADIPGLPDFHRRRVKEFVINNLCDPTLNVDMIAKAVGLSVRYLHKLFENERLGLMRWAAARRLEYCRDRLSDPRLRNRSISDIAYEAGFNDLAHFSRSFRKSFNTSPSQARGASAC